MTAFKINTEYALAATYFLAALLMVRRRKSWSDPNLCFLAAGAWVLGLAELLLTLYARPGDLLNVVGHAYKAAAYAMLYRALFVSGCRSTAPGAEEKQGEACPSCEPRFPDGPAQPADDRDAHRRPPA